MTGLMYLFVLPILLFCATDDATAQIREISKSDGAFVIYNENWQLWHHRDSVTKATQTEGAPNLIFVLWNDGKVIWSRDEVTGGPPYLTGNVNPETIGKLIGKLKNRSYFWTDKVRLERFNPHDYCTAIRVITEGEKSIIRYDLELRDLLDSSDIRQNFRALKAKTNEELLFQNSWFWLRLQTRRLLPSEFKKTTGQTC